MANVRLLQNVIEALCTSEEIQLFQASKDTFFETHLNNGGQFELVRNVVLGTLAVCALIVGLTLCYRKKVCFSGGEKKPVSTKTKTVNGYQYNATADEVVSSPETERLS